MYLMGLECDSPRSGCDTVWALVIERLEGWREGESVILPGKMAACDLKIAGGRGIPQRTLWPEKYAVREWMQ